MRAGGPVAGLARASGDAQPQMSLLAKVRLILDAFELDGPDRSLADLVAAAGLSKTTVFRLCQELVAWGMLERVHQHQYRLGLRVWEMGQRVPRQRVLREAALPHLEQLLLATRETVHCAILDGTDVLYIEKLTLRQGQPQPSQVAGRLPLHCTATGKALLAHAPMPVVRQVLSQPLARRTPYTVTAPGLLARQLERVRLNGIATEREETRLGYLSMAAPVFGPGDLLAGAISVTAPLSPTSERRLEPALRAAAAAVDQSLRHDSPDGPAPGSARTALHPVPGKRGTP